MAELDDRVSSEEFTLHQVFWSIEPGGPAGEVQRWAALMAATANGPMVKRDKSPFKASDFWPDDVWSEPEEAKPKKGKKAMLAPDFSQVQGLKVAKPRR